jgi:hypothetical protein
METQEFTEYFSYIILGCKLAPSAMKVDLEQQLSEYHEGYFLLAKNIQTIATWHKINDS